ncbi:hypothetical protein [Glutamicibacter sp.]|uniref:hypothetical protein n=1 Tax=Glutamicibacter sp. TaxID=1931995 RepID=UPI0028BEE15D|nr:hypothetical protein [Glutamicibacter sp.]
MADSSLLDAIESGRLDVCVAAAVLQRPEPLIESLDYHRITENAEPYWEFAKAWIAAAGALDKTVIARWVVDISLSEFAYLEIQSEAAQLLVNSVQDAKNFLAGLIEDVSILSDNPDAGLSRRQVQELKANAQELAQLVIPGASN